MYAQELQQALQTLRIILVRYSLNGDMKTDAYILAPDYAKWEVFYMDERYGRHDVNNF